MVLLNAYFEPQQTMAMAGYRCSVQWASVPYVEALHTAGQHALQGCTNLLGVIFEGGLLGAAMPYYAA